MVNLNDYDHISFDLWLTLIKSNPEYKMKRVQLTKSFFGIEVDDKEFFEVFTHYDKNSNRINEVTGGNIHPLAIYSFVLARYGVKPTSDKMIEFYDETEKLFLDNPPVLLNHFDENFFIEAMNKGITMNILSNTGFIKGSTLHKFLESIGYDSYFNVEFYSDEHNMSKPNPEFFNLVADYVRHETNKEYVPSRILHVGDNHLADVLGAEKVGFSTYYIEN